MNSSSTTPESAVAFKVLRPASAGVHICTQRAANQSGTDLKQLFLRMTEVLAREIFTEYEPPHSARMLVSDQQGQPCFFERSPNGAVSSAQRREEFSSGNDTVRLTRPAGWCCRLTEYLACGNGLNEGHPFMALGAGMDHRCPDVQIKAPAWIDSTT